MRQRGFEVVKRLEEYKDSVILPERNTKFSAGYDFIALDDIEIPSVWVGVATHLEFYPTLVKLGVKAYMQEDELLTLCNRSSNPKKKGLIIANSIGIIDSDYYNNTDNDGEIGVLFYNIFPFSITIKKGDKVCQGIFSKFLKTDSDTASGERLGGFGSTGE